MAFIDQVLERLSGVRASPTSSTIPPLPVTALVRAPPVPQPVKIPRRSRSVDRRTYLAAIDTPLARPGPKDDWTIEEACAGTHILGGNGAGKTSASGRTIAKAFLHAGFGGVVLCAKPDERANWERYAKECGRSKHLIIVPEEGPWRFNFIQYELGRPYDPTGRVDSLVTTLMNLA